MHSYPHCVLIKLQKNWTIFRFYSSCLPFGDNFFSSETAAHSPPLADLSHRVHPVSYQPFSLPSHRISSHLKVSSPKPPGWGPCQLLPGELGSGTGFSALFELGGESVPSHLEQLPAATRSPFMPPPLCFAPAVRAVFPPFFPPPQAFRATAVWSGHAPFLSEPLATSTKNHWWRDQISLPVPFSPTGNSALFIWGHRGHQGCLVAAGGPAGHTPLKSIYSHFPFISPPINACRRKSRWAVLRGAGQVTAPSITSWIIKQITLIECEVPGNFWMSLVYDLMQTSHLLVGCSSHKLVLGIFG